MEEGRCQTVCVRACVHVCFLSVGRRGGACWGQESERGKTCRGEGSAQMERWPEGGGALPWVLVDS